MVGVIISVVSGIIMAPAMIGAAHGPAQPRRARRSPTTRTARMGKLDQFGKKMEEANKRMEAAQKSGDPKAQMEAAMGALGTALSGGKGVEPVQLDTLKPLLPETFAGLPRRTSTHRTAAASPGLMVGEGEGVVRRRQRQERERRGGGHRRRRGPHGPRVVDGHPGRAARTRTHREVTRAKATAWCTRKSPKTGGATSITVVLADRFVVSAAGHGVDIDALKSAVAALDLGKIESLK